MKQYITTALCSIIFFVTFFCLNSMELTGSNDDFQKFFANQELFSTDTDGEQNCFRLDIVEDFVQNYEKEKPKLVEPTKVFSDISLQWYQPSKVYSRVSPLKELCAHTILKDIGKYDFDDLPIGELENIFEYPGFPQAVKKSIFKAAFEKQGSKSLYGAISDMNNDYKTKMYRALGNFASSGIASNDLQQQINSYLIAVLSDKNKYDQRKSKELLSAIAFSYSIELKNKIFKLKENKNLSAIKLKEKILELKNETFELKSKILLHQVAVYSDGKRNPFDFLEEAIKHFVGHNASPSEYRFYKQVIDYCFKNYPLYAAKRILDSEMVGQKAVEIALAIVKAHNLLERTIDNNPEILQEAVKKEEYFALFLKYGIQPSPPVVHEVVKAGNFKILKVLAQYGAYLNVPEIIDSVLATNNLACIHFMLNQQKDVLKERPELCDFLPDLISKSTLAKAIDRYKKFQPLGKEYTAYNLAYAKEVYKALLRAQISGNIQPLKEVIFNFDYDIKKLEEIGDHVIAKYHNARVALKMLASKKMIKPQDKNAINEAISVLSTNCSLLKRYPIFLASMIEDMEAALRAEDTKSWVDEICDLGSDSNVPLFANMSLGFGIFLLPSRIISIEITNCGIFDINLRKLGIGFLILAGWRAYAYFKEYNKEYYRIKDRAFFYEQISYFMGYLKGGAQRANGQPIENFQEEKFEQDMFKKLNLQKVFTSLWFFSIGFCPASLFGPYLAGRVALAFALFGAAKEKLMNEGNYNVKKIKKRQAKEDAKKLVEHNFNCGKRDGAKIYGEQLQLEIKQPQIEDILSEVNTGSPDVILSETRPSLFKAIFGIAKNLFDGFISYIPKYEIRNKRLIHLLL